MELSDQVVTTLVSCLSTALIISIKGLIDKRHSNNSAGTKSTDFWINQQRLVFRDELRMVFEAVERNNRNIEIVIGELKDLTIALAIRRRT